MKDKLSLGISPCPNDTFMFDAMINGRIDVPFEVEVEYADVEALNQKAFNSELDVTKISFHAWAKVMDQYQLLTAGAAMGFGVGPLLISKEKLDLAKLDQYTVGIPGIETTANFLLRYAFPQITKKEVLLFSDIEAALVEDNIDLGVIIHENRFTYQNKGLHLIRDLGTVWESETNSPIPLGGIAVKRSLSEAVKQEINQIVRTSVQFAFDHPSVSQDFVSQFAQEMDPKVMKDHIDLYVNEFSLNLNKVGLDAIDHFLTEIINFNIISSVPKDHILSIKAQ